MDVRSQVRATQLLGSSNGGRVGSNSMSNHHLVQHVMVWLLLVALSMRQLQLVGDARMQGRTKAPYTGRQGRPLVGGSTSVYMQLQW